jgi:hypothetical protein
MMKENVEIAYLIMAHNQPCHLNRLVNALNDKRFHFFIHVDGKADISEFLQFDYPANSHFVENRFKVFHEGFSIVSAMIELLTQAIQNPNIDYFFFLSGWDYPIKSNEHIRRFLGENYPKNFINFYPLVKGADFVDNIRKYYLIDFISPIPRIFRGPLKRIMQKVPVYRPSLNGLIPYRGSAWFCINRDSVRFILDFLKTPKGLRTLEYYRYSFCADEMIFHTILLNSTYSRYCNRFEDLLQDSSTSTPMKNENKAYLHYIDWDQTRENPALLDMCDLEKLQASDALFARKFHEKKSANLLSALDQLIMTNEKQSFSQ